MIYMDLSDIIDMRNIMWYNVYQDKCMLNNIVFDKVSHCNNYTIFQDKPVIFGGPTP